MKKQNDSTPWVYSDIVREHFFNPRNFMTDKEEGAFEFNAKGEAGSPACGDVMKFWLKIDSKTEKIMDCRWQTFGCGSAIAATSVLSEMIKENGGMTLEQAKKIKPRDIIERLNGLPEQKIHCSVLGDQALRNAIEDYHKRLTP